VCFLSACTAASSSTTVHEVIDGDTIEVALSGRLETVRLLGIDTPETVHPDKPPECFGAEASSLLTALLPKGTSVTLQRDEEPRDHYGRLLAYVFRSDGLDVGGHMLSSGAARTLAIAPNSALTGHYAALESEARAAGQGLWSAC
jgi:micrococcal nuclease